MVRESLRPDARQVMLAVTAEHGLNFLHRLATAEETGSEPSGQAAPPIWLKLKRQGNLVVAYSSPDGASWEWVGTEQLDLPEECLMGLAVCSHDNSSLGTATFDQVSLAKPKPSKAPDWSAGSGDGLPGTYFDQTTGNTVSRKDANVDFDWDIGSPTEGIGKDFFSARWEGFVQVPSSEVYALHVISDDGARLWLDGNLLIDAWFDQGASQHSV
jgi:hypothetical protein